VLILLGLFLFEREDLLRREFWDWNLGSIISSFCWFKEFCL